MARVAPTLSTWKYPQDPALGVVSFLPGAILRVITSPPYFLATWFTVARALGSSLLEPKMSLPSLTRRPTAPVQYFSTLVDL